MPDSTILDGRPDAGDLAPKLDGDGFSVWVTPKTPKGYGWEGLLRFDHLSQEQATSTATGNAIAPSPGIAYWFPRQGAVSAAILFDFEQRRQPRLRAGARPTSGAGRSTR